MNKWNDADCNVLQNEVDNAAEYTYLKIRAGNYCNKNFYKNHDKGAQASGKSLLNHSLLTIKDKKYLKLQSIGPNGEWLGNAPAEDKTTLKSDGWRAIKIINSEFVIVNNFNLVGPSLNINGVEATKDRERISGHIEGGSNHGALTGCALPAGKLEADCDTQGWQAECKWSESKGCLGRAKGYYRGVGIEINESMCVNIYKNDVHHFPGSGIKVNKSDSITISSNNVYGNNWWNSGGSSALVFSESVG